MIAVSVSFHVLQVFVEALVQTRPYVFTPTLLDFAVGHPPLLFFVVIKDFLPYLLDALGSSCGVQIDLHDAWVSKALC